MDKKYNVLLITSDQQHFDTIGKFNSEISTPNLDRLCETGTYFNRAYTVNPTCTPTRATLIAGTYPSQHGAWTLGTKLNEAVPTIGDYMHQKGMKTALVGKAHFQPIASTKKYVSYECEPILQDAEFWGNFKEDFYGFDTFKLTRNHTCQSLVGYHYTTWLEKQGCHNWRDYFEPETGTFDVSKPYYWHIPEKYHYNAWIADESETLLETYKESGDQFFLWSSFFDPHPKYFVPDEWVDLYQPEKLTLPKVTPGEHDTNVDLIQMTQQKDADYSSYEKSGYGLHGVHCHVKEENQEPTLRKNMAVYYSMVTLLDKYIGKILDKLEDLGLRENTIIVFTTDHGHYFGQHGLYAKGPFLYEDSVKVPYIVSCPGTIPQNEISSSLQSLVDIPVTMLDYCGVEIPYHMTGINQREVWEGKQETVREHIICEHNHERDSINLRAYVDERYKLVIWQNNQDGQLYDLLLDPGETKNLWNEEEYKDLRHELMMKYINAELKKESLYMPRIAIA